jgi:hypothetical protein
LAKPEQFPEEVETGRIWGTWNKRMLPVRWETVEVSLQDAYRIRIYFQHIGRYRFRV